MRLGATLVHWCDAPQHAVAAWAERLVGAGFDSLWAPEIIGRGSFVPDPFVTLGAAAAITRDIELGTATVQVPLHHPAELAHRVLSLMSLCGDRLTLGISPGSTKSDFTALDRDYDGRFAAFHRDTERLRELLAYGRDRRANLVPVPPASGQPRLLLGSWGVNVVRAARDFDGWLASGYRSSPDEIIDAHGRYRAAGGRRAIVCAIPVRGSEPLDATGAVLQRYAEAGFDDAVVVIEPGGVAPEEVRALLPPSPSTG